MKNWYKRASDLFFCITFLSCLSISVFGQNMFRKVNDFDGDGKADFAITRDIGGLKYWYIWQSTQGLRVTQFGLGNDQNTAGDYDGDGKYDPAVFRKGFTQNGSPIAVFWAQGSQSGTITHAPIGVQHNNYPMQQDYDGDGKTDFATTDGPLTYTLRLYTTTSGFDQKSSSNSGNFGRIGDLTGDGKADIFTYNRESNVATIETYNYRTTGAKRTVQFGVSGDQFIAADFDGDGKGELAIFRHSDGMWWWIRSSDNSMHAAQFGQYGDNPVPADYDGDGKTDLAIWRQGRTQSVYWVYGSLGTAFAMAFGDSNDLVVAY